jgi:hypothetical protein
MVYVFRHEPKGHERTDGLKEKKKEKKVTAAAAAAAAWQRYRKVYGKERW